MISSVLVNKNNKKKKEGGAAEDLCLCCLKLLASCDAVSAFQSVEADKNNVQCNLQQFEWPTCFFLSYLSDSLADRRGTTVVFTTSFLHSLRFLAFHSMMFCSRPVHSLMLSSHCFLCLPVRLPPWTVPCRIVLASPDDRVTCPYNFSLHLFTEVRRSSYGLMEFPILAFTFSLDWHPLALAAKLWHGNKR